MEPLQHENIDSEGVVGACIPTQSLQGRSFRLSGAGVTAISWLSNVARRTECSHLCCSSPRQPYRKVGGNPLNEGKRRWIGR